MKNNYCFYYTAKAVKSYMWLIIAHLKSNDNIAFHRTMDGKNDEMEFFVTPGQLPHFLSFLESYKEAGFILNYQEEPNRILFNNDTSSCTR